MSSIAPRIGVFAHMFHAPLFAEMRDYLLNIPGRNDLYLSTCTSENFIALKELFAGWSGRVDVCVVPNRGRDIAPKLITFRADHAAYDYVLHIHTKNNAEWRRFLLERLLGSRDWVERRIIYGFQNDPTLGMVAPEYWPPIKTWAVWGPNRITGEGLLARISVSPFDLRGLEFPTGAMFWARPAALKPIFAFGLTFNDFPPEPIGGDGTLAHAVERLFFIACEVAGYRWKMVTVPEGFLTSYRIYHPAAPECERRTRNAVEALTA